MAKPPLQQPLRRGDPFEMIIAEAGTIRASALKLTDPERVQTSIRAIDSMLKQLSTTQREIGSFRKSLGVHVQSLRQVTPKGKPAEGTIREIPGTGSYIYLDGAWSPFKGESKPVEARVIPASDKVNNDE